MASKGAPAPDLAAAYEECRRIHASHGRTYYLATQLLPRHRRPDVWALYAFARVADELVDAPSVQPADPAALLAWREQALSAMESASTPDPVAEPVLAATWHTMHTFGLDPGLLREFLDSMVMDLTVSRYATWEELRGYTRGSAAVIGELMAPVLGSRGPEALTHAAALGEAFQLTNFIRDVAEDLTWGRIYLPLDDLSRFGVTEDQLGEAMRTSVPSPQVRSLIAFEVRRALGLYAAALPGLGMVDARSQPCLEAAFTLYRRILHRVIANDFNVFEGRLFVPTWQRLATAGHLAARAARINLAESVASSRRSKPTPHRS
ncbi:MAG: phytoene/squalene synthase family protein [Dermatophilaceae bacterium]